MRYTEQVLAVACEGQDLAAVLAMPEQACNVGVLIVVGGPQYRVGSHRQFVLLARQLAAAGITTLRFDCRGMGDSSGSQRTFEDIAADIDSAIGALRQAAPSVQRIALWGLCDGASASLMYLDERTDPRVSALCLVNPWVRSAASLARTHIEHHYWRRLHEPAFWARLLTGRVGMRALSSLWRNLSLSLSARQPDARGRHRPFQLRMADAWRRFPGPILLILSGNDYTADEFRGALNNDPVWRDASHHAQLQRHDIAGADHTLSDDSARQAVEKLTVSWLLQLS